MPGVQGGWDRSAWGSKAPDAMTPSGIPPAASSACSGAKPPIAFPGACLAGVSAMAATCPAIVTAVIAVPPHRSRLSGPGSWLIQGERHQAATFLPPGQPGASQLEDAVTGHGDLLLAPWTAKSGQQCSASGAGERIADPGPQDGQGGGAGLPGGHLPAAQDQQGRDGLGPEPLRDLRRGIDVHLDQLDLACQVAGELLERGADHAAGPAPGRPQIDEDRNLGGLGDLAEGRVVGVSDPRQRPMALAAARRPGRCGRYPVCLAAVPAPDNLACHSFIIPFSTPGRSRPVTDSTSPARAG